MKKSEQKLYLSPVVEVCEIEVEQCLSSSLLEDIGDEKDPIDWD